MTTFPITNDTNDKLQTFARHLEVNQKTDKTNIIVRASSMKSSSRIVPVFMVLTATSVEPLNFPFFTT